MFAPSYSLIHHESNTIHFLSVSIVFAVHTNLEIGDDDGLEAD